MREKWNKKDVSQQTEGQPGYSPHLSAARDYSPQLPTEDVGQRIALFPEMHRPKLRSKVPSMRAINTYNSISTDNLSGYDNLTYTPDEMSLEYKLPLTPASVSHMYDYPGTLSGSSTAGASTYTENTLENRKRTIALSNEAYDYPSLHSSTSLTGENHGEMESKTEGSRSKLISSNTSGACWSCFVCAETILCTISLAAGLGNLYRLPQTTLIRGGLPFLVAYIILSLFIGLPLLFLELGLGQLAQEGFIKIWRAVPIFRGLGYVKFGAISLLSLYYSLYIGLFINYLIWFGKGPPPFTECATVKITDSGYKADGIPGQECLQKTFLESAFTDPKNYGIYVGIIFLIWITVMGFLIGRTKTYSKLLVIFLIPILGCVIALIVKAVKMEQEFEGLQKFATDIEWSLLGSANIWYYAIIQVFFATHIGFGPFVTNAGTVLSKANAFWTAVGYVIINLVFGIVSVILCFILSGKLGATYKTGPVAELHLLSLVYDTASEFGSEDARIWSIVTFCMLILSGFVSLTTLVYAIVKALRVETKQKLPWWQALVITTFVGMVLSALLLLPSNFAVVHLLDHYVVGNLVLLCTVFEILAIVAFYGSKRIQLDFEFILGKSLSKLWIVFWWLIPFVLSALFIWALCTVSLTGIWERDPAWLYSVGWALVFASLVIIFALGCYQVQKQDEYYTFNDKLVAVTKPLRNWGPVDPIMRYSWVQWHSKAKNGERDFTLKRRGTRDYTHSVKKRREPYGKAYIPTISSNPSTLSRNSPRPFNQNDLNQNSIKTNYAEPLRILVNSPNNNKMYLNSDQRALHVTSFNSQPTVNSNSYSDYQTKTNLNPLSVHTNGDPVAMENVATETYGTFRKGPYVIPHANGAHICHRKYNEAEISTEL
ncbi:hypothetical protein PPYR_10712 [Photinus pyralis]|uniref:Transporter n=1 Tax=Photinus pyralis TaxID=7054 RepID=A0A5N4AH46_PHOPY|nr:sodium-dependent nutrient amino acid transporter 1 isoform X1 [Photinus pyralis]KAB0796651.1 hypothetical protein PPYR_10712 [Photinus pyralis]